MLWQHRGVEEATWEREGTVRANYLFLFDGEGALSSHLCFKWLSHMHVFDCVYVCVNFGTKFF